MRVATWSWGGRLQAGTVSDDGLELTPLAETDGACGALEIIERLAAGEGLPRTAGTRLPIEAVTLAAPVPQPRRNIFCIGRNYRSHAAELATTVFREVLPEKDNWPMVFTKLPESVVGPYDTVRLPDPATSHQIDYESELALVIGKRGRNMSRTTGTPAGVGMGFQPPKWLQPGDRVRVEIDGIGAIENLFDHA